MMHGVTIASAAVAVSPDKRWLAVGIGLAFIVLVFVSYCAASGKWSLKKVFEGLDGQSSTSKFQWLLWLIAILFVYVALWVIRAEQGTYTAISNVPANLLTVLGFSTATAVGAKGITASYVQSNRIGKQTASGRAKQPGGLLQDDAGIPELAKIQMLAFTVIALGIFIATFVHQIVSNPVVTGLPNIDSSLLVLMGISQGGYLGKKLVTFGTPILYPVSPAGATALSSITVQGANLGATQNGSQLLMDGTPITIVSWSDTSIQFAVPAVSPRSRIAWATPQNVAISAYVGGRASNSVTFIVT